MPRNVSHTSRTHPRTTTRLARLTRDEADGLSELTSAPRRLKRLHPKPDMQVTLRLINRLRRFWARTLVRDELLARITASPTVCNGHPVLIGTQLRVWVILDALIDADLEEVLRRFPVLSYNDIRSALAFASEVLKAEFDYEEEGNETSPKSDV